MYNVLIRREGQESVICTQVFPAARIRDFRRHLSKILPIVFSRTERIIKHINRKGKVLPGVAPGVTRARGD